MIYNYEFKLFLRVKIRYLINKTLLLRQGEFEKGHHFVKCLVPPCILPEPKGHMSIARA
jgi:hypothetical protein